MEVGAAARENVLAGARCRFVQVLALPLRIGRPKLRPRKPIVNEFAIFSAKRV
jgi:hypothetical protein